MCEYDYVGEFVWFDVVYVVLLFGCVGVDECG